MFTRGTFWIDKGCGTYDRTPAASPTVVVHRRARPGRLLAPRRAHQKGSPMALMKTQISFVLLLAPLALTACGGDNSSVPKDRPDLQMVSMTVDPAQPVAGEEVVVSAVVKNIGTADAPATMSGVTVGGTQICSEIPTVALAIQQTATVACSVGVLTAGSHGIGFCADVTNQADEPDETNNCVFQMVEVAAAPGRR